MKTIAKKAPMEKRKPDLLVNPVGIDTKLEEAKRRDQEQNKVPLRIDHRTIILVKLDKRTKAYADQVKHKYSTVY